MGVFSEDKLARTDVVGGLLTRPSGGGKAGAAAADEATGRPRETSPPRTRPRGRLWGVSRRGRHCGGKGKRGRGQGIASGIIASADKSGGQPWGISPRTRLPREEKQAATVHESTGRRDGMSPPWMRRRGDHGVHRRGRGYGGERKRGLPLQTRPRDGRCVHCFRVNIPVGRCGNNVADEAAGERGGRSGQGTAAGCVASMEKASSVEGRGGRTCCREPRGRL